LRVDFGIGINLGLMPTVCKVFIIRTVIKAASPASQSLRITKWPVEGSLCCRGSFVKLVFEPLIDPAKTLGHGSGPAHVIHSALN
jgi:hypothetical protein